VSLGPITLHRQHKAVGKVKVAVRPEAWQVMAAREGRLAAKLIKSAYLGNAYEYTFDTELGAIFVLSADVEHVHAVGQVLSLGLAGHGLSVVSA
jgi:iron(III) transport system ATP-binding protein